MTERTTYRTAGTILALASIALIAGNLLHPRPGPDSEALLTAINTAPTVWAISHFLIAAGLVTLAAGALVILTHRTQATSSWSSTVGWGLLVVVAPVIGIAILAELGVLPLVADAGNLAAFERWEAFSFTGIVYPALGLFSAFALIAGTRFFEEDSLTARIPAGMAVLVSLAGLIGAVAAGPLGQRGLMPVVGVSLLLVFLWVIWFAAGLARQAA